MLRPNDPSTTSQSMTDKKRTQMASPFTELECYIILLSLLVFSLFTLHGMIHERCTPPTGKEGEEHQYPIIV
ncbi:hypothetical protein AMELA_G00275160 [Ameiurus melas]|uniref:Uncharacterized protein n=1 Tax=Ameiurus melas TaxID=219545 RepID=A0A7J5ZM97_AMEME|nr:hypothetical protein AMELA_G00275160 [Ameiurus melas]